jgi:hypothetical protein
LASGARRRHSSHQPAGGAVVTRELDPLDVLIDLLGSADFPAEVLDPEAAARIIIQRLDDAGFQIR